MTCSGEMENRDMVLEFGGVPEMDWQNASMLVKGGIYYGISFASYFTYFVIFDRLCLGSTPGKSIAGYKLGVREEDITWS